MKNKRFTLIESTESCIIQVKIVKNSTDLEQNSNKNAVKEGKNQFNKRVGRKYLEKSINEQEGF